MNRLPELYASMVFNETVMRERLPKDAYTVLKKTMTGGKPLEPGVANVVANSMKDWAIEKGATHYTHWFQPMTGVTAEKHDSFITPDNGGGVIMEFSGGELIRGESDASSFPSGGLRATFEARGYTSWDPTSYAFIRDETLYIPTAFCSYGGEALDNKTPLLRSMGAIDRQAKRILKLFGTPAEQVFPTVGPEQEYFLVDREHYNRRKDLIYTGRTLFGAAPPKGQEMDDHYFGIIKLRISAYMKELDKELWKLGIPAKTEHNEAAPAQYELATIFTTCNVATDHNQVTMEIMRKVAKKHGFTCLLHEKPFAGVNGSGKHNNWSLSTDKGQNLFDPGHSPEENAQFLLFLCAVIEAVDTHQDLLRICVAGSGNDHRLGGCEAPPAILSMYIGEDLESILESIESGRAYDKKQSPNMNIGVDVLPSFPRDTTDRNRTSPFAFTGNKFEFRMPGSSQSIAWPNTVLNTIMADSLCRFADRLEAAVDFGEALNALIRETIREHRKILFSGNGYGEQWVREAKERGLLNLETSADAIGHLPDIKNIGLFERHSIFTESEIRARYEIQTESYCKSLRIEALTMAEMVQGSILPAAIAYGSRLAGAINAKKTVSPHIPVRAETALLEKISALTDLIYEKNNVLHSAQIAAEALEDTQQKAGYYREVVLPAQAGLRAAVDELETWAGDAWPYPSYGTLLYMI